MRRPFNQYYILDQTLERSKNRVNSDSSVTFLASLIYLAEVQKSGAKIYFCPGMQNFCTLQKRGDDKEMMVNHFETYREAYKSEDW